MWNMYLSGPKICFVFFMHFIYAKYCFLYIFYLLIINFLPFDFVVKCDQMWNLFYFIFRFFFAWNVTRFSLYYLFFCKMLKLTKLNFLFFPFDFVVKNVFMRFGHITLFTFTFFNVTMFSWDFPTYITWLCFDMHVYVYHFPNAFNQTSYFKTKDILVVQIGMLTNVCCTVISCIKCGYCTQYTVRVACNYEHSLGNLQLRFHYK